MAKIPIEIKESIDLYLKELSANNFHIQKAFLFGSYANGKQTKWSDIDITLISKDFEGNRFLDKDKIRSIKLKVNSSISPLPYTPEDFDEESYFIRDEILTGIRIV